MFSQLRLFPSSYRSCPPVADIARLSPCVSHLTSRVPSCGGREQWKSTYKIVAAVVGSFVLGVGAANILHAQSKPPAYVFAEIDVKDQDAYSKDYLPKAQSNIEAFGGKRIAGGFNKAVSLRGAAPPNRVVLLQFPGYGRAQGVRGERAEASGGHWGR